MKKLLAAVIVVGVALFAGTSGGFGLISNGGGGFTNDAGDICYHEDSVHDRVWYGELRAGETFTVDLPVCGPYAQWPENVGMAAFRADAWRNGNLELSIVSPSGAVTSATEVERRYWVACVGPVRTEPFGHYDQLQNGVWRVELTNTSSHTIRGIYLRVHVNMWICGR